MSERRPFSEDIPELEWTPMRDGGSDVLMLGEKIVPTWGVTGADALVRAGIRIGEQRALASYERDGKVAGHTLFGPCYECGQHMTGHHVGPRDHEAYDCEWCGKRVCIDCLRAHEEGCGHMRRWWRAAKRALAKKMLQYEACMRAQRERHDAE